MNCCYKMIFHTKTCVEKTNPSEAKCTRCIFSHVWCFPGNCSPHSSFISGFSEYMWRLKSFCQMKSHQNTVRRMLIEDKWSLGATSCLTFAQIKVINTWDVHETSFEVSTCVLKTTAGMRCFQKVVAYQYGGEVWGSCRRAALSCCDLICCSRPLLNCLHPCCYFSGSVFCVVHTCIL